MRLSYNSPIILTFSLLCVAVHLINLVTEGATYPFFSLNPNFGFNGVSDFSGTFLYTLGHANFQHLISNLTFLLLLGPILEEKYKAKNLLLMILVTTLITALLHKLFFNQILLGASGLVFMCIILASFVNVKQGTIPLTFILIVILFLGKEIYQSFREDNISQFAHIIGGICGGIFGFLMTPRKNTNS